VPLYLAFRSTALGNPVMPIRVPDGKVARDIGMELQRR
jgi:hypothetical protein